MPVDLEHPGMILAACVGNLAAEGTVWACALVLVAQPVGDLEDVPLPALGPLDTAAAVVLAFCQEAGGPGHSPVN